MKHRLSRFAVFVLLLFLLSGCTPVGEQPPTWPIVLSDELLALLETVNAEHKAIVKPEIDEAAIVERWARDTSKYSLDYQIVGSMTNGVLTAQQAKNDVNVLFYNLQTKYGLYEYFGGDGVFDVAKVAILEACDAAGTLTPDELADILLMNFSFVKDAHFTVDDMLCASVVYPFHYRDVAFEKVDGGYQSLKDKKRVNSVDGYEDLDTLFRRSISVVLAEITEQNSWAEPFTPDALSIRYADGSTQILRTKPYGCSHNDDRDDIELYENRGIPVLFSSQMGFDEAGDQCARAFLAYAEQLKDEPVVILDLRLNMGGNVALPYKWLHAYSGKNVTGNSYLIDYIPATTQHVGNESYVSDKTLSHLAERVIGGRITLSDGRPDVFVENGNLLIALTGKHTASAAETMVDLLHNVGNVLFIGDLTYGCYVGLDGGVSGKLPCSQVSVKFGSALRIFPEGGHFQEMRGFFPDLWVPADQAEELALKLLFTSK